MRTAWVLVNIVLWTIIIGTSCLIVGLFEWRGRLIFKLAKLWSRIILLAAGVKYTVRGLEHLDRRQTYIFASNHESAFDIPLAFAAIPHQLAPIAKIELRKIPLFGWAMIMARHIFVDRHNREKALNSMQKARASLQRNPRSILLFPEGTRSLDGQIHAFKKGGLVLGIELQMPVVPMAMCGTAAVITKHSWNLTPRPVELRLGAPIDTGSYTYATRNDFVQRVREEVIRLKQSWQQDQDRES